MATNEEDGLEDSIMRERMSAPMEKENQNQSSVANLPPINATPGLLDQLKVLKNEMVEIPGTSNIHHQNYKYLDLVALSILG